jgi:ATP-dependent RNA helicase SUPV3L1/SUV3
VAILWRGHEVARLGQGKNLLSPRIQLDRRIDSVSVRGRDAVIERLQNWVRAQVERSLAQLRAAGSAAQDGAVPAPVRAVLAMLVDEGGIVARDKVAQPLAALDREQRRTVTAFGIRIGALDIYMPAVLKPEAMRWRTALRAAASGQPMTELPPPSSTVLTAAADGVRSPLVRLGFRAAGPQMIRVDMADRLARHAHEVKAGNKQGELVNADLVTSLGLQPQAVARLMRDIGFRPDESQTGWVWRGRAAGRAEGRRRVPERRASGAFAVLARLKRG